MKQTDWELEKFLKVLFYLFHNTYGRRSDFKEITKSNLFPLKFSDTRWVEDQDVGQRALDIWENVCKYVTVTLGYTGKDKAKIPTCGSFTTVKEAVLEDPLITAKLEFFIFVTGLLKLLLTKYQSEEPLIVYLGQDLATLLNDLMELFIDPEILKANNTQYKLAQLNVKDKNNQMSATNVNIGNGARTELSKSKVSDLQKMQFRMDCIKMLTALVSKLQERCPLKYSIIWALWCLDPNLAVEHQDSAKKAFMKITSKFMSTKHRTRDQCDKAEREYSRMLREEQVKLNGHDDEQLDKFYYALLKGKYPELWEIVKRVLLLSHGQASVERGFSINNDMLFLNMKYESMIGQRLVYDTIKSQSIEVHQMEVSDKMLAHCR